MSNKTRLVVLFVCLVAFAGSARGGENLDTIKKSILHSTLNQAGTNPFHLKASFAPTLERDQGTNRTGDIEIWWESPTEWKREIHSPGFSQVEIVNGSHEWQKNSSDYFPEWLRETAQALIEPVPALDQVLDQAKDGEIRHVFRQIEVSWPIFSTDGTVKKSIGAGISVSQDTRVLLFATGFGFSGSYKDYENFHNRAIARTVEVGNVTAKITTLEDLKQFAPDSFDAQAPGGDVSSIETVLVAETESRKNLLSTGPIAWPALKDGPLQGVLTTQIVIDRSGKVRDIGPILSDNPGLSQDAGRAIVAMQFKPYVQNGMPVQVVSRITMPFKTVRPAGIETFESARDYFENGRSVGFPAAGAGPPYTLRASFKSGTSNGTVQSGEYVDTWMKADEWRREATIGKSRFVRSQHGDKRYLLAEGPDAKLLAAVLRFVEPIPAIDTFVESDWRIKRDDVDGVSTIRIISGYESPDGELDSEHTRGYWFDSTGRLVQTYFDGLKTKRSAFKDFNGAQVAQQILVFKGDALGMAIQVTALSAAGGVPESNFVLRGHEWRRAFTAEVR